MLSGDCTFWRCFLVGFSQAQWTLKPHQEIVEVHQETYGFPGSSKNTTAQPKGCGCSVLWVSPGKCSVKHFGDPKNPQETHGKAKGNLSPLQGIVKSSWNICNDVWNPFKDSFRSLKRILRCTPRLDRVEGWLGAVWPLVVTKPKCSSAISCTLYLGKQCHNLALVHFQAIFCALLVNILLNQPRHTDKEKGSVSSEEKCSINNSVHQERVFANPLRVGYCLTPCMLQKSPFCLIVTSPFYNPSICLNPGCCGTLFSPCVQFLHQTAFLNFEFDEKRMWVLAH